MALSGIRSVTRHLFTGAQSGGGSPAWHGLARRLSSSSKPNPQSKPKSIPKAEPKKKSKTERAVGRPDGADDDWLTPRVQLRRACLGAIIGLLSLNLIAGKADYSRQIYHMKYKIKIQTAKKELLEEKLSKQTQ